MTCENCTKRSGVLCVEHNTIVYADTKACEKHEGADYSPTDSRIYGGGLFDTEDDQ